MTSQNMQKKIQILFRLFFFVLACPYGYAQDDEPMGDTFSSGDDQVPVDQGTSTYGPSLIPVTPYLGSASTADPYKGSVSMAEPFASENRPRTPDGTDDASRATSEFAKTLPNNPRGLVQVIKGLLTERHPKASPNGWYFKYWRGRCFVAFDRLSFLDYRCYLAWYHAYLVSENLVGSGDQIHATEFQKRWALAQKICDSNGGDNSPMVTQPGPRSPSNSNRTPSSSQPSTDYYNSNPAAASPPAEQYNSNPPASPFNPDYYNSNPPVSPPATPQTAHDQSNKMPPLAPQRGGSSPAKKTASQPSHHLPVEKIGPVPDEFARKLDAAQNSIPAPLLAFVKSKGYKVRVITSIADYNPQLAKRYVPGYPAGLTAAHSYGYTDQNDRSINIAQHKSFRPDFTPQATLGYPLPENPNPAGTFRHEFGHALDRSLDDFSSIPAFKEAYEKDIDKIPWSVQYDMRYYFSGLANGDEQYARSEAFAELIAGKFGSGGASSDADVSLRKYLPDVSKLIDDKIGQLQMK